MSRQFNTDCEGPISKNDNAMELSEFFIPRGRHFFSIVSKYDDYLADIEKRRGYQAGDTLKLVLPFFKAFGATDETIRRFSQEHLLLLPGAREMLHEILERMDVFILSTSYAPYIEALCRAVDFPEDRTYSTQVRLEDYDLSEKERKTLIRLAEEMTAMEMIEWPDGAQRLEDLADRDRKSIQRLDQIFWQEIDEMAVGKILLGVNPVGGKEKARAVLQSLERTGNHLEDVLYAGDSITDVEAFELVRKGGGMTLSFNGNRYALRSAELACLSSHAFILAVVADIFRTKGREGLLNAAEQERPDWLISCGADPALYSEEIPKLQRVTEENRPTLIQESETFRKQVRGVRIGTLG